MLQKTDKLVEQFYRDFESHGFKFPGKVLRDVSVISRGYASEIVNHKREPSLEVIKAFYREYPKSSQNGHIEQIPEGEDAKAYWARFDEIMAMAKENSSTINNLSKAHLLYAEAINSGSIGQFVRPQWLEGKGVRKAEGGGDVGKSKTHSAGKKSRRKGNGDGADK